MVKVNTHDYKHRIDHDASLACHMIQATTQQPAKCICDGFHELLSIEMTGVCLFGGAHLISIIQYIPCNKAGRASQEAS